MAAELEADYVVEEFVATIGISYPFELIPCPGISKRSPKHSKLKT